jgi:putative membrane protein
MISLIIIAIVGLEHLLFGFIEMFGDTKLQAKAFGFDEAELKNKTLQIALSNQGIYNIGFGLMILALAIINAAASIFIIAMLFVILVGIYGALTVTKKILFVQALPALLALICLLLSL